jgi:hypothetical protein
MRLLLGVLAGYLIFAVSAVLLFQLTDQQPHEAASLGFVIGSTVYGMFFGVLAGYVASVVHRKRGMRAAAAVSAIIALSALISFFARGESTYVWSMVATLIFIAPVPPLGAILYLRRGRDKKHPV